MGYLYLVLAGILSGGIVFGGKVLALMGATPFEVMLYPNLIGALLALPFSISYFKKIAAFPLKVNLLFIAAVFVVAIGQYLPLFMNVSVTLVLLLIYLQPVWTILIERFYFKHAIPREQWFLVAMMICGLIVLINPFAEVRFSVSGVLLALGAGLGISLWILVTKYFSVKEIAPAATYFCTCFYALVPLVFLYLGAKDYMLARAVPAAVWGIEPTAHLWLAIFIYSVLIYTPANTLVFYGNKKIPAAVVGMILLLEPVTGIALDVVLLHSPLTWNIMTGGMLILLANVILIYKSSGSQNQSGTAGSAQ